MEWSPVCDSLAGGTGGSRARLVSHSHPVATLQTGITSHPHSHYTTGASMSRWREMTQANTSHTPLTLLLHSFYTPLNLLLHFFYTPFALLSLSYHTPFRLLYTPFNSFTPLSHLFSTPYTPFTLLSHFFTPLSHSSHLSLLSHFFHTPLHSFHTPLTPSVKSVNSTNHCDCLMAACCRYWRPLTAPKPSWQSLADN